MKERKSSLVGNLKPDGFQFQRIMEIINLEKRVFEMAKEYSELNEKQKESPEGRLLARNIRIKTEVMILAKPY